MLETHHYLTLKAEAYEYYKPFDERIFKPVGTETLLTRMKKAYEAGDRSYIVYGPAGVGKTVGSRFFVNKTLGLSMFYMSLPVSEYEGRDAYFLIRYLIRRFDKIGLIIDELEKTKNLEVIGWICRIAELPRELLIGITNRPWIVQNEVNEVWRRFVKENGRLIPAEPHNHEELLDIVNAVTKRLDIKNFTKTNRETLTRELAGYNYESVLKLFTLAKDEGDTSLNNILRILRTRLIPLHSKPVVRHYMSELEHRLQIRENIRL